MTECSCQWNERKVSNYEHPYCEKHLYGIKGCHREDREKASEWNWLYVMREEAE